MSITTIISENIKGVLFVALFAATATLLSILPFFQAISLHPLIIGMLGGIIYANTIRKSMPKNWEKGIHFSTKRILRLGIILYGFRITFQNIFEVGISGIIVSVLMVILTFIIGVFVGIRVLKLDRDLSILIASGAAICGAAAVLATESVLKSKPWKSTVAVATVVIFGTSAMCLYPIFYKLGFIPFNAQETGLYIGGSIHEVAHVVAAGNAISPEASNTAIIVKMIRVMMLAPFLIVLGVFLFRSKVKDKGQDNIPWFAILFIIMAGINSLSLVSNTAVQYINIIDNFLLTMAMSALGMETHMERLKGVGMKPIWLGLILFTWLIFGGYFIVFLVAA